MQNLEKTKGWVIFLLLYYQILLMGLKKVALTFVHFAWHEWKWTKWSKYLTKFSSKFKKNLAKKYFGFLQNKTRNYGNAHNFTINNKIILNNNFVILHFCYCQCKKNSATLWALSKFRNCGLVIWKWYQMIKSQYCSYLARPKH